MQQCPSNWPAEVKLYHYAMDCPIGEFTTQDCEKGVRRLTELPSGGPEGGLGVVETDVTVYVLVLASRLHIFPDLAGILLAPRCGRKGGYQRIGYVDLTIRIDLDTTTTGISALRDHF